MSNVTTLKPNVATRYLSAAEVCELIPGMTERRLEDLRGARRGPRYFKPTPKTVVYAEDDVHAWVQGAAVQTRADS